MYMYAPLDSIATEIKTAILYPTIYYITHSVFLPVLLGVVGFPPTGGKNVLVSLVPATQHHFTSVRLQRERSL